MQDLRLARHDQRVLVAMDDQKRRGVLPDKGDRVGELGELLFFLGGAAEQFGDRGNVDAAGQGMQVGRAEKVEDTIHLATHFLRPDRALEFLGIAATAEQGDQVAAGGGSGHADSLRVDPMLFRVGPQIFDRPLHVVNLGREFGVLAEPVIGRGDGKALGQQPDRRITALLGAGLPTAAVHPKHQRKRAVALRNEQVEFLSLVLAIGEVLQHGRAFGDFRGDGVVLGWRLRGLLGRCGCGEEQTQDDGQ